MLSAFIRLKMRFYYLFQVIINFPDPAQKSEIVQLRGPRNEVEKCAKFMQKIVAEMVITCPVLTSVVVKIVLLVIKQYFSDTRWRTATLSQSPSSSSSTET